MSGGRATVARAKGIDVRQAGDICAVAPEGNDLVDDWYIECKFYRDIQLGQFLIMDTGVLAKFWQETKRQARRYGREPMLIVKQNKWPVFVVTVRGGPGRGVEPIINAEVRGCEIAWFNDMVSY